MRELQAKRSLYHYGCLHFCNDHHDCFICITILIHILNNQTLYTFFFRYYLYIPFHLCSLALKAFVVALCSIALKKRLHHASRFYSNIKHIYPLMVVLTGRMYVQRTSVLHIHGACLVFRLDIRQTYIPALITYGCSSAGDSHPDSVSRALVDIITYYIFILVL